MLPKLGTYAFPAGRCEITRSDEPEFNEAGQVLSNTIHLEVTSYLYATSAATMDLAVRSLLTAFETQNGKDFVVYLPGGSVKSQLSLYGAGSMAGVRIVKKPRLEAGQQGAYVTYLPFSFALEAQYPAVGSAFLIREWKETLKFDSMDRFAWLHCLHGPHQLQQVREFPFWRATQSWRGVGFLGYIQPPDPLWPNYWMNRDVQADIEDPRPRRNGYIDYPASIEFRFESDTQLRGFPHAWPIASSASGSSSSGSRPSISTSVRRQFITHH
jgi:hypothetical protein